MEAASYYTIFGALLFIMSLCHGFIRKLPMTPSIVYLFFGILIGPQGFGLVRLSALEDSFAIEVITEITVIVALFTVGLKLKVPLRSRKWILPMVLASVTMIITIGAIALVGEAFFGLSIGEGILLGAILAPTDPVLASEVQMENPEDHDPVKFALTTEGGMNDGTAFPFVMLGLGMVGVLGNDWSPIDWALKDLLWAIVAGVCVGGITGFGTSKLANFVKHSRQSYYMEDFLTISSIALSYGFALLIDSYGFLAVFANALTIRHAEFRTNRREKNHGLPDDVLSFNEQLEHVFEVVSVVTVGVLLDFSVFRWPLPGFAFAVLLIVRPLAIGLTIFRVRRSRYMKFFLSWFGIRGIGSLYYLSYAANHGLPVGLYKDFLDLTLGTVAFSILWHGMTVKPVMRFRRKLIPKIGS